MIPYIRLTPTPRNSRAALPFPARWCARRFALAPDTARTIAAHAFNRWEGRR
jgi:hypothetical protein